MPKIVSIFILLFVWLFSSNHCLLACTYSDVCCINEEIVTSHEDSPSNGACADCCESENSALISSSVQNIRSFSLTQVEFIYICVEILKPQLSAVCENRNWYPQPVFAWIQRWHFENRAAALPRAPELV